MGIKSNIKLKFDATQDFQLKAIDSITQLFKGQPKKDELPLLLDEYGVFGNSLDITEKKLFDNLSLIQEKNTIPFELRSDNKDFSIEMETGTGKTYTYFRSIYELNLKYGWNKFIIIVPSISIKEGVLKSFELLKEHFSALYSSVPCSCYEYDSKRANIIKSYGRDTNINIMVMTLHSFNKENNVIKQNNLDGFEYTPIKYIRKTKPIIILDEPQNMESDISKKSIGELNPLFTLRFSATHKNYYNLLYRLAPYEAYSKGLVKKIEVFSLKEMFNFSKAYIKVIKVGKDKNKNKPFYTNIECFIKKGDEISQEIITLRQNESLERKTKNSIYEGYTLQNISTSTNQIQFSNSMTFSQGQDNSSSKKDIQKLQIKNTIQLHFKKQKEFFDKGLNIKVLSLFFIDRVDNYINDGFIKQEFEKQFEILKDEFEYFRLKDKTKVHNGYFAKKVNKKSGQVIYKDELKNNSLDRELEKEVYNLIMKDKEKLLSFDEDTCFIFSHSTLKEGWDNPNIFQIATLNETKSDMKKRQEIGRGLRLCVNSDGNRVFDKDVNLLSVVSNESYEEFVSKLQEDYENEYFKNEKKVEPKNGNRKRELIKLKKEVFNSDEFKTLWKKISAKTKYKINFDSNTLINNCIEKINNEVEVDTISYEVSHFDINMDQKKGISAHKDGSSFIDTHFVGEFPHLIKELELKTDLTIKTICNILKKLDDYLIDDFIKNPYDFINKVSNLINNEKTKLLVNGLEYEELKDENGEVIYYDQSLFSDYKDICEDSIVDIDKIDDISNLEDKKQKSLYDSIVIDSNNEKNFVSEFLNRSDIKLFVKLPKKFIIPTPIGNYNPDWGYIKEEKDIASGKVQNTLYFIGETKTSKNELDLRGAEKLKIDCGKRLNSMFDKKEIKDTQYKVITKNSEI